MQRECRDQPEGAVLMQVTSWTRSAQNDVRLGRNSHISFSILQLGYLFIVLFVNYPSYMLFAPLQQSFFRFQVLMSVVNCSQLEAVFFGLPSGFSRHRKLVQNFCGKTRIYNQFRSGVLRPFQTILCYSFLTSRERKIRGML